MDITRDIQPMTTFRNQSAEIMRHLKETKRPVILTVNGKAAGVLQDAEAHQHLVDLAAEASAAEGIRQGLDDLASEPGHSARDARAKTWQDENRGALQDANTFLDRHGLWSDGKRLF